MRRCGFVAPIGRPSAASALSELIADWRVPASRGGSLYRTPLARRKDTIGFAEWVIEDARQRFGN